VRNRKRISCKLLQTIQYIAQKSLKRDKSTEYYRYIIIHVWYDLVMARNLKYKWEQLSDILLSKIESGECLPGHKLPSEKELCASFGVSRVCVRMVLDQLENQKKIVRLPGKGAFVGSIYDLPFEHRPVSHLIALTTFGLPSEAPTMTFMENISEVVRPKGYHLIVECIYDDPEFERNAVKNLLQKGCDGFILTATAQKSDDKYTDNSEYYKHLSEKNIPFIIFDRFIANDLWSTVSYQTEETVDGIIQELFDAGRRKIAYIGITFSIVGNERHQAYLHALKKRDLPIKKDLVILAADRVNFDPFAFGRAAAQNLSTGGEEFDAVVTFSDAVAYGAYTGLKEAGWKAPESKYLGGFEIQPIMNEEFRRALITTELRPLALMGRRAAELLLQEIEHHGRVPKVHDRLPVKLIHL